MALRHASSLVSTELLRRALMKPPSLDIGQGLAMRPWRLTSTKSRCVLMPKLCRHFASLSIRHSRFGVRLAGF